MFLYFFRSPHVSFFYPLLGTRDSQIEQFSSERAALVSRQQAIREELAANEKRIHSIDTEVDRLKKEKVAHVEALEAKSKALFGEMNKGK